MTKGVEINPRRVWNASRVKRRNIFQQCTTNTDESEIKELQPLP